MKKKPAKIKRRCPFCYAPAYEIQPIVFTTARGFKKRACECGVCCARGPAVLAKTDTVAETIFDWNRAGTLKDWTGTAYQKARDEYARTHE